MQGVPVNGTPLTSASGVTGLDQDSGENIRVLIRIRPLNEKELTAGDQSCVQPLDPQTLQITLKGQSKEFRFHQVLGEVQNQGQVFGESGLHMLLDSALDGYASCVFAYGQTGSGKTYTMAGIEERLGRADYVSDETDGIIPRAISYLWQGMAQRQEVFYVKAAFLEIYNEQVRDLLNPSAGVRHCRWNIKSGFFVEDLLIVDCHNIDDLISVLHEGIRNRKTGSHELNADSSRSHSIMLLYFISEIKTDDQHSFKKYGKIYFVDLAGSERLKETKSQGEMIKETGNINKSLFTLGKVISALGDKKQRLNKAHIPYRDSKLTMLLMDSLGGNSKALMIGCVSPASAYADETFSTLQYASRTMNIKNKPVVQMDNKEQIIFDLRKQIEIVKMENAYLQEQITRAGVAPVMNERGHSAKSGSSKLPPLPSAPHLQGGIEQHMTKEYSTEINRLKQENQEMLNAAEVTEKNLQMFALENQSLSMKLSNLEHVFTEYTKGGTVGVEDKYTITNVFHTFSAYRKMNVIIAGKYRLEKKIGSGAFGDIYLCTSIEDNKLVAIKIEKAGTRHPQLLYESRVVKQLFGAPGLPTVLHSGVYDESNVMVMDLLGPSLEELLVICNKKMSLRTVLMLADQMLCRLHYIHSKNYIHRDVKPENFLIGMGRKSSVLHMVDFGLAKQYRNPKSHRHIPYRDGKSLTGTARYASLATHIGIEQSRRDDIEGFAYVVIYLLKGALPWQGIQATSKEEKYRKIQERKMSIPIATLCSDLPDEIAFLVQYARGLTFEQKPDYAFLRRTVKGLFLKKGFEYDYVYDWTESTAYSAMIAKRSIREEGEHHKSPQSEHEPHPRHKLASPDSRDSSCIVF